VAARVGAAGARVADDEPPGALRVVGEVPKAPPPPPPGPRRPPPRPAPAPAADPELPTIVSAPPRRSAPKPEPEPKPAAKPVSRPPAAAPTPAVPPSRPAPAAPPEPVAPPSAGPARRGRSLLRCAAVTVVALGVTAAAGWLTVRSWYASDLPSVEALRAYRPATVTTVLDRNGETLGEIYEQRRYVLPLDRIPERVRQAFVAAEDAGFWEHGGMDWMGIGRAVLRNAASLRVAQGGSTITQQVAKNFLLTSDRKLERKIKEMFLAWRIEEAYDKEHILFLYLNEIFLGSQAYGVEAAARTFFGKHVDELTLGEAAMIAGLPPRPSEWNPHADLEAAKRRRAYVLQQMVASGYVTQAEADAANAEEPRIVPRNSAFLTVAPHFTEHVRRYLVERYGEQRVLAEGLQAVTTCDLALQRKAQEAVTGGVTALDQGMGLRREAVVHLGDDATIAARRADQQEALAGAALTPGKVTEAVVLEVHTTWARLAIGDAEGILPLAWADWAYPPDPERNSRYRHQDDLGRRYDLDDDGEADDAILQRGDVLRVQVEGGTRDEALAKVFADTPGATASLLALRLRQVPEVESALLSFELSSDPEVAGAVRAMVGGADFERSQLNRAVQARRQVGSTFKPIVYAAALDSRKLTTASIVPDAPLAMGNGEDLWKPGNYGGDYRGNITLRQALALSRNTSTVRVLDAVDPGMARDVVYRFAAKLGIGATPTHLRPADWTPTPDTDHLCPWVPKAEAHVCPDKATRADGVVVCRACDLSIGLGSTSLTMEELARAYAIFANGGRYVEPWYVVEVRDRDGKVLERHEPAEPVQVIDPGVASLATWLLEQVTAGGTGYEASKELRVHVAGKTGTTNDEKDAWFVGFTPDVVTAVWVGFDQPRSLGAAATGGHTALPIWIDYMREAIRGRKDRPFTVDPSVEWVPVDEASGRRVESGGRKFPFLEGTVPESTGYKVGEATIDDLATEL
jgi:penicillin-binding protein 1A